MLFLFFLLFWLIVFFFLQNVNRLAKFTTLRSKQCRNLIKPFKNKCLNYFFFSPVPTKGNNDDSWVSQPPTSSHWPSDAANINHTNSLQHLAASHLLSCFWFTQCWITSVFLLSLDCINDNHRCVKTKFSIYVS